MTVEEVMRLMQEANRFRTDNNLMDRNVVVQIGDKYRDVQIEEFLIDYKGDLCIVVEEPDEEE
jgi:hypothetical protein